MKNTEREALKLAQMALSNKRASDETVYKALHAIQSALAQPSGSVEQEPVAFKCGDAIVHIKPPVYGATPPQPEQEPVAYEDFKKWMVREMPPLTTIGNPEWWARRIYERFIYTTPPQRTAAEGGDKRTWVGLTDEEVRQMCGSVPAMREAVREAEAKLKEKNT